MSIEEYLEWFAKNGVNLQLTLENNKSTVDAITRDKFYYRSEAVNLIDALVETKNDIEADIL